MASNEDDNYNHPEPGLIYIDSSYPGIGCDESLFESQHAPCKCTETCNQSCSCGNVYSDYKLSKHSGYILECNDLCQCGKECPNRLVQKGPLKHLEIRQYGKKGNGLATTKFIPKGSFVCEYAGEYIGSNIAKERFKLLNPDKSNYILIINECSTSENNKTIIDPTVVGNIGRYINHSCDPNLKIFPVRINSMMPQAALFATCDIEPETELCYNYHDNDLELPLDPDQDIEKLNLKKCLCLGKNCRGYIPFEPNN